MLRFLAILLFCLAQAPSDAAWFPLGAPPVVTYQGPLDIVGSATSCWSLRACSGAIATAGTQKLINLERTSDSQTCDFLVASNGGIGTSANCSGSFGTGTLASFCNATTCELATVYDQVAGSNAVSANPSTHVVLTQSGIGSLPVVTSTGGGGNVYLKTGTISAVNQPYSWSFAGQNTSSLGYPFGGTSPGNSVGQFDPSVANTVGYTAGSNSSTVTQTDGVTHSIQWVINNSATSYIGVDGNNQSLASGPGANSTATVQGFAQGNGAGVLAGFEAEQVLWPVALTTGQMTSLCQNQQKYWSAGNFGAVC